MRVQSVSGIQTFIQAGAASARLFGAGTADSVYNQFVGSVRFKAISVRPMGQMQYCQSGGAKLGDRIFKPANGGSANSGIVSVGAPPRFPLALEIRNGASSKIYIDGPGVFPIDGDGVRVIPSTDPEMLRTAGGQTIFGLAQNYNFNFYAGNIDKDLDALPALNVGREDSGDTVYLGEQIDVVPTLITDGYPVYPWYKKMRVECDQTTGSITRYVWSAIQGVWIPAGVIAGVGSANFLQSIDEDWLVAANNIGSRFTYVPDQGNCYLSTRFDI